MDKQQYREYITGREWHARRAAHLALHSRCAECDLPRWVSPVVFEQDLHVHHVSYARVGEEPDDDLQTLCRYCHEIETFGSPSKELREVGFVQFYEMYWLGFGLSGRASYSEPFCHSSFLVHMLFAKFKLADDSDALDLALMRLQGLPSGALVAALEHCALALGSFPPVDYIERMARLFALSNRAPERTTPEGDNATKLAASNGMPE